MFKARNLVKMTMFAVQAKLYYESFDITGLNLIHIRRNYIF